MPELDALEATLARARRGDRQALRELLEHFRPQWEPTLRAGADPTLRDRRDATTLLDHVAIEIAAGIAEFRGRTLPEFSAWLVDRVSRTARKIALPESGPLDETLLSDEQPPPSSDVKPVSSRPLDRWRHLPGVASPEDETLDPAGSGAVQAPRGPLPAAQVAGVAPFVAQLPNRQRRAIELRYFERRDLSEVAALLEDREVGIARLLRFALHGLMVIRAGNARDVETWVPEDESRSAMVDGPLAEFLALRDAGKTPPLSDWLIRHPAAADGMREFLALEADLLRQIAPNDGTLDANDPAARFLPPTPKLAELPREFGDYDIVELIARGGMGVVYKAQQRKLNRTVALKMILAGAFARPHDIERFYAEAEAAAGLQHPNIVRIHDVGQLDGQHYFSMDYIEGTSLGDLVHRSPLDDERAAGIARKIALAVHYAHTQGIIHRDLKPANVLLDKNDEPHLTDFGLAKTLESDRRLTVTGAVLGTPNYMPPEQATGAHDEVGPRSDVYAIGAILYEMLTGRPPFSAPTSHEVIQQVIKNEPVSLRSLNPAIPAELETICEKCLQKDPLARYASALDLAEDLSHYLAGEPIQARPVSGIQRAANWCRRNPLVAGLTGAVVGAAAIAILAVVVAYFQTADALARSKVDQQLAEDSFQDARKAVDQFFLRVSEEVLLGQPGLQQVRRDLLSEAQKYYQKFIDRRGNDPKLREELALTRYRLGWVTAELESPQKAIPIYREARTAQEALLAAKPGDFDLRYHLSNTLNALGIALHRSGEMDEARRAYEATLELREGLVKDFPKNIETRRKLANAQMNLGLWHKDREEFQKAIEAYDDAQAARELLLKEKDDPAVRRDLAVGFYNLGILAMEVGDPMAGETALRGAVRDFARLLSADPKHIANRQGLALAWKTLADLLADQKQPQPALDAYEKARGEFEVLAIDNPTVPEYRGNLAMTLTGRGELQLEEQQAESAAGDFAEALRLLNPIVLAQPEHADFTLQLVAALRGRAAAKHALGDAAGAKADLTRALELLAALAAKRTDDADLKRVIGEVEEALKK